MFLIVNDEDTALGNYFKSTYIVQGEYYIAFTDDINEAKVYTTLNRANLGLEKLYSKIGVRYKLSVKEVK